MSTVWSQRRAEFLSACLVSPDVFPQMVDRLAEFVEPYQQALEAEAAYPRHLSLPGLLSYLQRKNAEEIATLVAVVSDATGTVCGEARRVGGSGAARLGDR